MGAENRPADLPLHQFGGLNTRDSELGLPGNDSPYLLNVDLHPPGSSKMRAGCSALTTPGTPEETRINAVFSLIQPEASKGWIYCIAGVSPNIKIYRTADPATWSWEDVTNSFTLADQKSWGRELSRYYDGTTEYPSCLYIPRSNAAPLIAIGQTLATGDVIALPAAAQGDGTDFSGTHGYPPEWVDNWPTHMRLMSLGRGSRMWAWGFPDNKSRAAYSIMNIPFGFTYFNIDSVSPAPRPLEDGGYTPIRLGDGDKLISVVDMFSYYVFFKRDKTFIFTGDPGDTDWNMNAQFPVGCVSDGAWQKVGNDIFFWANDGLHSLSAVQEYGDLAYGNMSFKISNIIQKITPGNQERIVSYHDKNNLRCIWFVPEAGSESNDRCYVYYYDQKKWSQWDGKFSNMMDVLFLSPNSQNYDRIIGASVEDGVVLLQSGFNDIDDDIESDHMTPWHSFGSVADGTRAMSLDVFFGDGGPDCDIEYQTDLNDTWYPVTRTVKSIGGAGTTWGNFKWEDANWGDTARSHIRYELTALFDMIRLRFKKTGDTGYEVMGYKLELSQKGVRL